MFIVIIIFMLSPFIIETLTYKIVLDYYRKNRGAVTVVKGQMLDIILTLFSEYGICPSIKTRGQDNEPFGAYSFEDDTIYANPTVKDGETLLDRFIFLHEVGHCIQLKEEDPHMMLYKRTIGLRTAFSLFFVVSVIIVVFYQSVVAGIFAILFLTLYIILTANDVACEKGASQFAIKELSKGATKKERRILEKFMKLCYTTYIVSAITGVIRCSVRLLMRRN